MKVVCPICKTEYDGSVTSTCPICNVPLDGMWPKILASETVYVKRESGSVFGPLPGSKVEELAEKGLIKDGEMLSLDKGRWHPFAEIRTEIERYQKGQGGFSAAGDSDLLSPKEDYDLLDVKDSDLLSPKEEYDLLSPKDDSDLLSPKEDYDLLDVKGIPIDGDADLLDIKDDQDAIAPKEGADLLEPVQDADLLEPVQDADLLQPSMDAQSVAPKEDLLSIESLTGASKPLEVGTYEDGSLLDVPDAGAEKQDDTKRTLFGMPAMSPPPKKEERVPSSPGDSLLGGGGMILGNLLDDEELDDLEDAEEPAPLPQTEVPPPDRGVPSLDVTGLDEEETIPVGDTGPTRAPLVSEPELEPIREKSGGAGALVWGLVGLLFVAGAVVGADWVFGFIGLFGKAPAAPKERPQRQQVPKVKAASSDDLPFTVSYPKLVANASKQGEEACEAALLLALIHHDFGRVDACMPYSGAKGQAVGNVRLMRIQLLRYALLLSGTYPQGAVSSLWQGDLPKDLEAQVDGFVKQVLASHGRDSSVQLYVAYLMDVTGREAKAREYLQRALDLEAKPREALSFMARALGIDAPATGQWAEVGRGWAAIRSLRNEFVAQKRKFPSFADPDKKAEGRLGPRFSAVMHAASAYGAWQKGDLAATFARCRAAVTSDPSDWDVMRTCLELSLYHGRWDLFPKVNASHNPRRVVYGALWYVLMGKKAQAYGLWEDMKRPFPKQAAALEPLFSALTKKKVDFSKALAANRPRALSTALVLRRISGALAPSIWNFEMPPSLASLVKAISLYHSKKWKELASLKYERGWAGSVPLKALALMGAHFAGQKDLPTDKALMAIFSEDAYGASYILRVRPSDALAAKMAREDSKFSDVIYLSSASEYYLTSKEEDRLMRARLLIERASQMSLWNMEVELLAGKIFLESGRIQEGEDRILRAIEKSPKDPKAFLDWADIELKLRRMKAALEALDKGIAQLGPEPRLLFKRAEINFEAGRPRSALKDLARIKGGFDMDKVYLMAGKCHEILREDDEALASYAMAVRACPTCPEANYRYGKALLGAGKTRQSITYLKRAVSSLKERTEWLADAHKLLGGAYKELGMKDLAIKHFRAYASLVPPGPMREEALRLIQMLGE